MKVFKFGGASVKDAVSVKNMALILEKYRDESLLIIISAMNKTTNALEILARAAFNNDPTATSLLEEIESYHLGIASELFDDKKHPVFGQLEKLFGEMKALLFVDDKHSFDQYYDLLVPYGELLSTRMISCFLEYSDFNNEWLDARELIITDSTFRNAEVDWESTTDNIKKHALPFIQQKTMIITQGFIGHDGSHSTTLGREGSDFSAAIFANILDAEEMLVWKDVPGYLNADPKHFDDTVKLDNISYSESIELAFFGAKIIHPKTIRPLKNKQIPLIVKSFMAPDDKGSLIHEDGSSDGRIPSCIIKEDQVLISISSRDFSFIAEEHLHKIFGSFSAHRCGINLMQNSAISFSVCVDNSPRLPDLINELQQDFSVKYNEHLRLITIRHYNAESIEKLVTGKEILLEQRSRTTIQMVIK